MTAGPVARAWVQQIMGMPISVHVRASDTARRDIENAVELVFAYLRKADAVFSTWNADSDLMQVRAGRLDRADADPWLDEVDALCRVAADATDGLFTTDLTGPDGTRGWDPTGLVKGWAVGKAADFMRQVDGIGFSINAGGDIVCGVGSGGLASLWRIGIQDPVDPLRIAHVIEIIDGAIATSGTSARGDHIVDPRSGSQVQRTVSTTVTGPDLVWADIWATACFVDPKALTYRPTWHEYTLTVNTPSMSAGATSASQRKSL